MASDANPATLASSRYEVFVAHAPSGRILVVKCRNKLKKLVAL